ncbi:hypothetical protein BJ138DRAFT_1020632, partial [Hygrophoropsis aurantiaca]
DRFAFTEKLQRNWAKGQRLQFFTDHLPGYAAAAMEGNSRASDYLTNLVNEYFQRFPWRLKVSEEPTSPFDASVTSTPEHLTPAEAAQKKEKVSSMRKAIHSWFNYRVKSYKKLGRHTQGDKDPWTRLLSQLSGVSKRKPKALQAHQRWSKDHFSSIVKSDFEERRKNEGTSGKHAAAVRDALTREYFDKIPLEEQERYRQLAKAEGKAAAAKWKDDLATAPSTDPVDRQAALDRLGTFAGPLLSGIHDILGMHVTLLVGGPEPRKDGQISVLAMHEGEDKSPIPQNWQKHDKQKFKAVIGLFQEYLVGCYIETVLTKPKPKPKGKTTKGKGKNKKRASDDDSESDPSESPSDSDSDSGSEPESPPHAPLPYSAQKVDYHLRNNATADNTITPAPDAERSPQATLEVSPLVPASSSARASASETLSANPGASRRASPTVEPSPTLASDSTTQPSYEHSEESEIRSTPTAHPSYEHSEESEIRSMPSVVPDSSREQEEGGINPPDTQNNAEAGRERKSPKGIPMIILNPDILADRSASPLLRPEWFEKALAYLVDTSLPEPSLPEQYTSLTAKYLEFEASSQFAGSGSALSTKNRPQEVGWWIARKRLARPAINLKTFAPGWWAWWVSLQPDWRQIHAPTRQKQFHCDRNDGDWTTLDQPGQNGILSVIACLKWWASAGDGKGATTGHWQDAVEDVLWVMDCIISSRKRAR